MTMVRLSPNVDVLIVGAGPAGLVAANTLARYGVAVLLVDKRNGDYTLSRALGMSTRGVELMRRFGIENEVLAGAADVTAGAWVTPCLTAGTGTYMPTGFPTPEQAALISPSRPACVAQNHFEPLLVDLLRQRPTATVRFGVELTQLSPSMDGVVATLVDRATGHAGQVRGSYVIGADGANSIVRSQLDIAMTGPDDLATYERIEFTAPLWPLAGEHRYGLYVIQAEGATGVLAPRGGDRWSFSREVPVGAPSLLDLTEDQRVELIRRVVGDDDVAPMIERLWSWNFAAQLADRYSEGRCYIVGDAAHRMTPRGGTGMNTAIQDAFDIGWKLAWVLRDWADPDLLDSYETERRPVAEHNVGRAASTDGANRTADYALPWDLNGRLPHCWIDETRSVSTIDLVCDEATLFVGPAANDWSPVTEWERPPVTVRTVDHCVLQAFGLPPTGALLVRPDGRELARWQALPAARTDHPVKPSGCLPVLGVDKDRTVRFQRRQPRGHGEVRAQRSSQSTEQVAITIR